MTALEEIKKAEHERIWLEPAGAPDRCWCQDNQWGDEGVEYVLASTLESLQRENDELRAEVNRLREALKPFAEIEPINVYESEDEDANGRYILTENQFRFARTALASTGGEHNAE